MIQKSTKKFSIMLFICILVLCVSCDDACLNCDVEFSANWQTEDVDKSGNVGIDPSIALDSNDSPHVCYYDQTNKDLKYAQKVDGTWQTEIVISEGDVGEECGIAIDNFDNPHISSNTGATGNQLKYATKIDGTWTLRSFEQLENYHIVSTSIALDNVGNPHIAFNIQENEDDDDEVDSSLYFLKYIYSDGTNWQTENLYRRGQDVYLDIDSNGDSHVCFRYEDPDADSNVERLYYAKRTSNAWAVSSVDTDNEASGDTGIAVDGNTNPHIVYRVSNNSKVMYAYNDGSSWSTQEIDEEAGDTEGTKIAVDGDSLPHIIYSDGDIEVLKYAVYDGTAWTYENIDLMGNPAIVIDSSNKPNVAHTHTWDNENGNADDEYLRYSVME